MIVYVNRIIGQAKFQKPVIARLEYWKTGHITQVTLLEDSSIKYIIKGLLTPVWKTDLTIPRIKLK